MKNRIIAINFLLSIFVLATHAQVAMGNWRTHFAYTSVAQIAQSANKIFAVSEGALYSVDKQDGSYEFYSKLSGLNGTNISRIEFDATNQQLLIIYSNGNMDVLATGGVTNIPDFYNKQISANKEVNQIQFYDNKAYLACNFGIVVLNMQKKEVADTYYIGPNASEVKVLNTTVHNGIIYALTNSTIFKASVTEPNLVNYEFWTTATGLPGSGNFQSIVSYAGRLFLLRSGQLYIQESNNTWSNFMVDNSITNFNVSNGGMSVYASNNVYLIDNLLNVKTVSNLGTLTDAEYDVKNNNYWFAGNELGVISYKQVGVETPTLNYYKPVGPAVNYPFEMKFAGEKLFVVPGGRWAAEEQRAGAVMMFEKGVWSNIYQKTIQDQTGHPVLDFMNVAVDPLDDKHFFVTSYGTGLFEFKNNAYFNWYNHLNSNLSTAIIDNPYKYIRLDGAIFDSQGNLWVTNNGEIKILLADGNWTQILNDVLKKPTLGKILILSQNPDQKWIPSVRYTPGICVFDDNGTITDFTDDKSIFHFSFPDPDNEASPLSPNAYFCIVQDKNGVVWVGTDQGPLLFHNPTKAFELGFTCSRVKIPRNDGTNLADYLLADEEIKAIAIDGANRKWLGTKTSGVYLMSENGQETIKHFTVSNSPLLSNDILSIAINPVSGEVFFGTGQGLVSYQSDAANAENVFGEVYAYPNPVREGYTGVITITGLIENTQVKITDLNGNLICETISNGSIATWDGKDVHGRKVSTGVYMVICSNADGTQSAITKILVIN